MTLVRQIEAVSTEIAALDSTLRKENKASELGPRLETIPSIGPVIASALRARVTDAKLFENGRHLAAWIGIVPENDFDRRQGQAEGALQEGRSLSALTTRRRRDGRRAPGADPPGQNPGVTKLLGRMSAKQAAIAIANKTARIAWAIMVHGDVYEAGHRPAHYRAEAYAVTG